MISKSIVQYPILVLFVLFLMNLNNLEAKKMTLVPSNTEIRIDILSQVHFSGIAGDYITLKAQISNKGKQAISDITTFMALVDTENKMPVDLEDWSAEKGLFIGSIDAGQTLPLDWNIHFVKAGTYELFVAASLPNDPIPIVSTKTFFEVKPKRNLNPGKVLPVALGMPIFLIIFFALFNYRRLRKLNH